MMGKRIMWQVMACWASDVASGVASDVASDLANYVASAVASVSAKHSEPIGMELIVAALVAIAIACQPTPS